MTLSIIKLRIFNSRMLWYPAFLRLKTKKRKKKQTFVPVYKRRMQFMKKNQYREDETNEKETCSSTDDGNCDGGKRTWRMWKFFFLRKFCKIIK